MKRSDRIKLNFTRNWRLPGRERLSRWLKPSEQTKSNISDGIVWLADENIAIYTSADNYIEWTILSTGTYEDEINKLIKISLRPGDIALDIGANIGLQSIRMSQSVGDSGQVYSFEPLTHLQQKFRNNAKLNKSTNIKLFAFALSNVESEANFSISTNNWNQGTFSIGNQNGGSEIQHVSIKVADTVPEIAALERLDLIKIDVEGFEFQVLLGLKQTLEKHRPRIIFEFDRNYWQANNQEINRCLTYLTDFNYTLYQITSIGCELLKKPMDIDSGNIFCMPF